MKKMTEENLKASLAGESQAHVKYAAFAEQAEKEGKHNVARLFRAASYSEQVHATVHLRTLGGIGASADNLVAATGGENFEIDEMYPAYIAVAQLQGEKGAERSMHRALETEKVHATLYKAAHEAMTKGQDASVQNIWVCPVCGFTMEGEPPDNCPLCNTPKDKFKEF
jgi:rubrerythrin